MKYITTQDNDIFIFPASINHNEFASEMRADVRGAGFVNFRTMQCWGESISLDIKMHEKDTETLRYHAKHYEYND